MPQGCCRIYSSVALSKLSDIKWEPHNLTYYNNNYYNYCNSHYEVDYCPS